MSDFSGIIAAIDRLANAFSSLNNTVITTVIATLGSTISVLLVESIKNCFFYPREEFKRLRRKVDSTLSMYACYYTNQIDLANSSDLEKELYRNASKAIRELSTELQAFANDTPFRKLCGVPLSNVSEAAQSLMALSNSFYAPYACPEMRTDVENHDLSIEIRKLLEVSEKS